MPGELNRIKEITDFADDPATKEISSIALRIRFIKKNIEKSLLLNHDCDKDQLEFLLQRL